MAFRGGLSIPDSLRAEASLRVNDLPDAIRDRYPRVEHDRMLYSDAASPEPAIRDLGDHLSGSRYDPRVARDLVAIAEHRGWSQVELWGGPGYQRQLWYEARLAGLKVVGYTPTPAELVELENRQRRAVQRGARPADGPDFDLTAGSAPRTRQVAKTDEPTPRPTPTPQAPADPSATGQRRDLWVRTPGDEDPASGAVAVNLLSPGGAVRSVAVGDVPARLTRRYFLDPGNGPGMGFYADAKAPSATFRDHGKHLSTERSDPNVVRDLVDIAAHRGWSAIHVRGQSDFRREAWIAARTAGLEVRGYRPTSRDLQELARRLPPDPVKPSERATDPGPLATRLNIIETVVRQRVTDPADQARILAGARARIANWLQLGAGRQRPGPNREMTR